MPQLLPLQLHSLNAYLDRGRQNDVSGAGVSQPEAEEVPYEVDQQEGSEDHVTDVRSQRVRVQCG